MGMESALYVVAGMSVTLGLSLLIAGFGAGLVMLAGRSQR